MIFLVMGIIIFFLILVFLQQKQADRQNEQNLRHWFGRTRDCTDLSYEKLEHIAKWYLLEKSSLSEDEMVDDITWDDLDMDQIFALANHTSSFAGEQYLYKLLHQIPADVSKNHLSEEKISYFDSNDAVRIRVQKSLLNLSKREDINYYVPELLETVQDQQIPLGKLSFLLFASLIILAAASLATGNTVVIALLGVNFVVNLALYALCKSRYEVYLQSLFSFARTVRAADDIYKAIDFKDEATEKDLASLKKLAKMTDIFQRKQQSVLAGDIMAIFYDYLIGALMLDFIRYNRILRELTGKQDAFRRLLSYVGETDTCIAVASFRRSLGVYCVPDRIEGSLELTDLRHPLIQDAVPNSFTFHKNTIITGSNAAGKSTFIKSVAVNLILGQTLHTCTATHAILPGCAVLTSMAVRDDVLSGESYYMREIKYLKRMVERSTHGRLLFCGIDEILKGTNRKERVAASHAILQYLKDKNCMLMVATHDLELAARLDGIYENYYFCETIEDKDVSFDYILRKGICQTSNAILLLQSLGFPEDITRMASKETDVSLSQEAELY